MMTEGARAIDWAILAVDFLVLIAILFFDLPEYIREHKVGRVRERLQSLMTKGQEIKQNVPEPPDQSRDVRAEEKVEEWIKTVNSWSVETLQFLRQHSPGAAAIFEQRNVVDSNVVIQRDAWHFSIHGSQRYAYKKLDAELSNLFRLMENAETYF